MLPPYHSKVSRRSGITYSLFNDRFRGKLGLVKQGIFFRSNVREPSSVYN
jgi:hypothetical protein